MVNLNFNPTTDERVSRRVARHSASSTDKAALALQRQAGNRAVADLRCGRTGDANAANVQRRVSLGGAEPISTMEQLVTLLGRPLSPYGREGEARKILSDWVTADGQPIDFDSVDRLVGAAEQVAASVREQGQQFGDNEIANHYAMMPFKHPHTQQPDGHYLPAVHQARPAFKQWTDQEYFYRAMTRQEAMSWLTPPGSLDDKSGQPWASYAAYSETYLDESHPYLLEIHAPDWLARASRVGVKGGKGESRLTGDISYGTGRVSETSTGFTTETNRERKQRAQVAGLVAPTAGNKGAKRNERREAMALSSIYFRDSILDVRPIRIKRTS